MTETNKEAFDRGEAAGQIAARLAGHDQHFATINGSIERLADEMHGVKLAVQGLSQSMASDRATVLTTASALKDAEEARRDKNESSWMPINRLYAAVAALAAIVGLYVAYIH